MATESVSPRYARLDAWEPAEILDVLVEGQLAAAAAVSAARRSIEAAALAAEARLGDHGRLVYAGAGTSGRLAVQDGAELTPTFSWPRERMAFLLAGGDDALMRPIEGAEDVAEDAETAVRRLEPTPSDVLIAVAASGTTPYTVAALRAAKGFGALTIGIANNPGTPLLTEADRPILLDTGPEAIAGSTRLKAGTAQKITLNLLSSLLMIRRGHVYDGLMVDVQATNAKLVRRSEAMLARLTGCSAEEARGALARADGNVKLAVLLLEGCGPAEAQAALATAGGHLRGAIAAVRARTAPSSTRP